MQCKRMQHSCVTQKLNVVIHLFNKGTQDYDIIMCVRISRLKYFKPFVEHS
jgi:hypothetical protein